jgi:Tfp pilus assembly protein PilF
MSDPARATAQALARDLAEAASVEQDRDERALLLHELAEIDERVRGDELAAAKNFLAAFNSRPGFRPPLFGLLRMYGRRRSVTNLAKLLEALIKAAPNAREKAEALVQRGELLEDRLKDPAGGRAAYEEAVEADETSRAAWLALERHGLKENDPGLVRRALLKLAELSADPARKARLWTEVATDLAREGTPEALDEASRLLREAAALPVGRWRALVELERFAERTARASDLVFALEGRAALAQQVAGGQAFEGGSGAFAIARLADADEARQTAADLWSRAARVRLAALDDPEGALSAMDQALGLQPDDPRFRLYALHLCDAAGDTARAAQHAAWLLDNAPGDATARGALHFRLAESAAANGNLNAAAESLRQALAANPESATTLGALVDQLVASGDGNGAASEFDRLAAAEENKKRRAALYRAAAGLSLAIMGDEEGAARRFRFAAEEDPQDALSRRALVFLQARSAEGEAARPLLAVIEELLKLVRDDDERVALLLTRLRLERHALEDLAAAAATAEALARAAGEERWALEHALWLRAASGAYDKAARLAEELAERVDGDARRDFTAVAARLHWAAGDEPRARALALAMHRDAPEDAYLAALAFRLALAANEPSAALDALLRKAETSDHGPAARWLLVGAVLLAGAGAKEASRRALEQAAERDPESPAVRAALLASTRWRADLALRARIADVALDAAEVGDEEVALGIELVLAKAFLEHDVHAAAGVLERVVARAPGESLVVALLNAVVTGSQRGPDAEETVAALQAVLSALPAQDPLRVAFELEVARALSSSSETRDQAREVRELLDEEQPRSAAPRLLALLDVIQRDERADVPTALGRVAEAADEATAALLRAAEIAALRAQGRDADARAVALSFPELPASTVALAEMAADLEHAHARAAGLRDRIALAPPAQHAGLQRRAAVWSSIAGRDDDAVAAAEALLANDPEDLVAWDVLRVAGRRRAKWQRVVDACAALAERTRDRSRASALWEEAGVVYLDQLGDARRAEGALRKALENDPRRVLAYRRLREILEKRKDHVGLEALVTTRIAATQEAEELTELYWEQARLRRALGRREEALESAKNVVLLEPEHVAALALVAEVHATSGRLAEAADALVALAGAAETPPAQRRVARLGAVDIFDLRLKEPARAIEQLERLVAEGDADDKIVERGVEIASRAELWDAAQRFAAIAVDRARAPEARARALLRVVEIQRDRLRDPVAALRAAQSAHDAMPGSLETLRAVHGLADEDERARRARRTIEALRETVRVAGPAAERALEIEQAARLGGDLVLARAAQRVARALGGVSEVTSVGVPAGRPSLRDPGLALRYRDPDDVGGAVVLLEAVMPEMAEVAGVSTDAFGVGRAERIKGAHPIRDALGPYAAATGLGEFELYVGGNDDARLAVVPGDPPAIVLGRKVAPPFDDPTRFRLARALLLTARGLAALQSMAAGDAADIVLAALVAAELKPTGGTARFEAWLRPVARALTRKTRKAIGESGRAVAGAPDPHGELARAARAALSTARRGALALSGAVSAALADLAAVDPTDAARRDLCLFALSDALVGIERETGVDRG